jgi:flavorubredoxin
LGTTLNSYLINGSGGVAEVIVDVPAKAYDSDLTAWLSELGALKTIKAVVVTRLNPERVGALKQLLAGCAPGVQLLLTNPALQLLKEKSGEFITDLERHMYI